MYLLKCSFSINSSLLHSIYYFFSNFMLILCQQDHLRGTAPLCDLRLSTWVCGGLARLTVPSTAQGQSLETERDRRVNMFEPTEIPFLSVAGSGRARPTTYVISFLQVFHDNDGRFIRRRITFQLSLNSFRHYFVRFVRCTVYVKYQEGESVNRSQMEVKQL
jgi:hypothetical protein